MGCMIRAKLEVNTARLKKLVLLAEVSTASRVYVDDIIFGSTKKSLCVEFKQMMHKRFQTSSMGKLTFFLGLQVKQKDDGIFISQDKYVADILKKFDFVTVKTTSTPIETNNALLKDEEAEDVDVHLYRSMIRSLMYLIASRPDTMFVVCACARFQYPKDSPFDLEALSDSDYAGASLDRKSTTGGCQFLGKRLISWKLSRCSELCLTRDGIAADDEIQVSTVGLTYYCMLAIQAEEGEGLPPPSNAQPTYEEPIPNTSVPIPNVVDEAVFKEWDDRVVLATTTAASLDAAQASGNITKTQSMVIPNVPLPQGIGAGGSPRCQEAMRGSIAQTRYERKVESLEAALKQTKKVYGASYTKLIKKVKKLEKTVKSNQARRRAKIVVSDDEEYLEDSSKQERMIEEIDQDAGITLVTPTKDTKKNVNTYTRRRRAVSTGSGKVSTASRLFSTAKESVSTVGASIPVSTAGMVQEVNISIPSPVVVKDKGKGIMTDSEDEQTKRTKLQQEQDRLGHEAAVRLQEELDEEER
ncbi:putative ribonuclease H-like domain-containing protein [Tanacetum coccineum]